MQLQGKYISICRNSVLITILLLICVPCFVKKNIKQSYGLPVAERSVEKPISNLCIYAQYNISTKQFNSSKIIGNQTIPKVITSQLVDQVIIVSDFLVYKNNIQPILYILFQQFRI